mgnify:CR=1 FL=1
MLVAARRGGRAPLDRVDLDEPGGADTARRRRFSAARTRHCAFFFPVHAVHFPHFVRGLPRFMLDAVGPPDDEHADEDERDHAQARRNAVSALMDDRSQPTAIIRTGYTCPAALFVVKVVDRV